MYQCTNHITGYSGLFYFWFGVLWHRFVCYHLVLAIFSGLTFNFTHLPCMLLPSEGWLNTNESSTTSLMNLFSLFTDGTERIFFRLKAFSRPFPFYGNLKHLINYIYMLVLVKDFFLLLLLQFIYHQFLSCPKPLIYSKDMVGVVRYFINKRQVTFTRIIFQVLYRNQWCLTDSSFYDKFEYQ